MLAEDMGFEPIKTSLFSTLFGILVAFWLHDLRKMRVEFGLLHLFHVRQSCSVMLFQYIICLPTAHFHHVLVRDAQHMRNAGIVVPEAVQAE